MKMRTACYALLPFVLAACSDQTTESGRAITAQTVLVSGSSTVYPLSKEAARRFERSGSQAHIDVKFTGSTAGFRGFCNGESDINNASRLINAEEKQACESKGIQYLELPIAMDSLAVVVHPRNTWASDISVAELKKIWEPAADGKINSWNDIRSDWPDHPIKLFGRGQDSGTYDYFTTAIVGSARSSRMDYTASEDEELLANGIAAEQNALGFFGIGAYHRHWNDLKLVAVDGVYPSLETVKDQSYTPLTRPLYLYVNKASLTSKPSLAPFLDAYLGDLNSWIHFTGYMPIRRSSIDDSLAQIRQAVANPEQ